ncbi:hypothetical protein VNO78_35165 [Psophocarpus tetragonolobus]|uniref:Uncharacterized protein n=1 Tax=Psophocarpus tetragonolobus TaxID=3891 RepID=A0AAN9NN79_PSOTE
MGAVLWVNNALASGVRCFSQAGAYTARLLRGRGLCICMTPADLTLSTPGANLLSVLPPRRRTGARVEPLISGVTAVERKKRLRSRNIRAGGTVNSAKI